MPELKIAQLDHAERARRLLRADGRTVEKRHAVAALEQGLDRADVADLDRAGKVRRRKTALLEIVFEDHARARALLAQQQRLIQQLRELPSPVTRGLVRRCGSDIFLRAKDEKVILRLRKIPLDHGEIQLAGVKLAQQHLRIRHLHPDTAVRVQVQKPAERLVEHELRDRERCAEGIVARAGGRLLHPLLQVLLVVLHRQQRPPQDLPRLGQLQTLAVVPEQRRAVCLLQIAYVVRDRRLRDAQLPRRFREIHVPAHGQKGLHAKIQHKRPSFPVVFRNHKTKLSLDKDKSFFFIVLLCYDALYKPLREKGLPHHELSSEKLERHPCVPRDGRALLAARAEISDRRRPGVRHPRRYDRHAALARQDGGAARHLVRVEKSAAVRRHPARLRHEPVRHLADRQAVAADHRRDDHDVARRVVATAQADAHPRQDLDARGRRLVDLRRLCRRRDRLRH